MLALSSLDAVLDALQTARRIDAKAYTLHGPVLHALEAAGRRGAVVNVELEKTPFDDRRGRLGCENRRVAAELRANGVSATLVHGEHAKTIAADSTLYLDAKNWNRGDLIVAEDDPARAAAIPTLKHAALEEERHLIEGAARRDDAIVESESFGCCNAVYAALERLALSGAAPRLLVCERELRGNRRETAVLDKLASEGVRIRTTSDSEKLAACGEGAWLGSANATLAIPGDENADWGTQTRERAVAAAVRQRLEERWQSARAYQ